MIMTTKRYERVNFMCLNNTYIQYFINHINGICDTRDSRDYTMTSKAGWLETDIRDIFLGLLYYHFEVPYPNHDVLFFIEKGIEWTIEYFYGDWREGYREFSYEKPMPREYWRYHLRWNPCFRHGLLFALLAQDKEPLLRIAEWIENDLYYDKNSYSAQEIAFQLIIAYYIRGKSPNDYSEQVDLINKSHKRFPKMCLAIFDTIVTQDTLEFERLMSKFIQWYIQSLIKKYPDKPHLIANPVEFRYHPQNIISQEASWLWNIALISGMKMPTNLSDEIMDRIVTPQSVGLVQ
jgi:hypothetical protein